MLVHTADWKSHSKVYDIQMKINFTDVFLDPNIDIYTTDIADFKQDEMKDISKLQAVNGKDRMTHKWFACDGVTICDGTYFCTPGTETLAKINEIGYWSNSLSVAGGVFSLTDPLRVEYSSRGVGSYFISFDCEREEYAVDFTVKFYHLGVLQYTSTITGNTECEVDITIPFQLAIDKVEFQATKLNKENICIKIAEFTTAVIKNYDLNTMQGFNLIEQREVSNENSIPQGNTAASELSFEISNIDREFDYNNTNSRLYGLIKNNARVDLSIGTLDPSGVMEYAKLFTGYVQKFSAPEESLTVTGNARNILEILRQTKIEASEIEENKSFEYWFRYVLNSAGIEDVRINIDSSFTSLILPVGWFDVVTHRFALQELARGSNAVVYEDRNNIINVKPLSSFAGTVSETFTRDHYKYKDNQPEFETLANVVNVTTQPLVKQTGAELYKTGTDKEVIAANTTKSFTFMFSESPTLSQNATYTFPAGVTLNTETFYSWGALISIVNANATEQEFEVTINGDYYKVEGAKVVQVKDDTSIAENGRQELTWNTSKYLQTKTQAEIVANTILASFKDPQKDIQVSFINNGNPCLELGDNMNITDLYSTTEYGIIEQEIGFNGLFTHNIKGRL